MNVVKNKYADFVIEVAQNMFKMLTVLFEVAVFIGIFGIPVGVIISLFWHIPWWVKILIVAFGFVLEAVCVTGCDRICEKARKENSEQNEHDSEK
jgi:hypothetical protein